MNPDPSNIIIRKAGTADAPQLARLLQAMHAAGWFSALEGLTLDELEAKVRRQLAVLGGSPHSTILVAATGDRSIVGYCNVHWLTDLFLPAPEGYMSELFLLPESRDQGIGRVLLDRVVAEAEERGAHRLMLITGRHRESYERGFYAKTGWEERPLMANFVYWIKKDRP